jgi:hypothetical protein
MSNGRSKPVQIGKMQFPHWTHMHVTLAKPSSSKATPRVEVYLSSDAADGTWFDPVKQALDAAGVEHTVLDAATAEKRGVELRPAVTKVIHLTIPSARTLVAQQQALEEVLQSVADASPQISASKQLLRTALTEIGNTETRDEIFTAIREAQEPARPVVKQK